MYIINLIKNLIIGTNVPDNNETLQELVDQEIANLKKYATKEEINNLNLNNFCATSERSCIYGQMTGNCYSERANYLIGKCAPFLYKNPQRLHFSEAPLNGRPVSDRVQHKHFSPIEIFIVRYDEDLEGGKYVMNKLKEEKDVFEIKETIAEQF